MCCFLFFTENWAHPISRKSLASCVKLKGKSSVHHMVLKGYCIRVKYLFLCGTTELVVPGNQQQQSTICRQRMCKNSRRLSVWRIHRADFWSARIWGAMKSPYCQPTTTSWSPMRRSINEHLCTRWCLPWRCCVEKQVMVRLKVSRSSTAMATDGALLLLLITRHH